MDQNHAKPRILADFPFWRGCISIIGDFGVKKRVPGFWPIVIWIDEMRIQRFLRMVVFHYQGLTHSFVSVAYVASCCGFSSLGRRNSWMGLTQSVTSLQSSCHFARTGGWPMMGSKGNMRQAIFLKIYVCRQTSAAVSTPCRWHQTIIPSGKRGVSLGQALVCAHNRTPMVSASTLSLSEKVEKQKMSKNIKKSFRINF